MKQLSFHQAVISTLAYSSVFDAPLTTQELYTRLIRYQGRPILFDRFVSHIKKIKHVYVKEGFVSLSGDEHLIKQAKKRRNWSDVKQLEIQQALAIFKKIPWITHVYVTGSLAVHNLSSPEDDIDFLVITQSDRLWITRAVLIFFTSLTGKYRLHNTDGKNTWCFNLWIENEFVELPENQRTLYTAYEVLQAQHIWGQGDLLREQNTWISNYFANYLPPNKRFEPKARHLLFLKSLNRLCYDVQVLYMKKRVTREKVMYKAAFFHPRDTQAFVLKQLAKKLKKYVATEH